MAELLSSPELETPFCLGIFGHWGTGKTTFMYLLEKHIVSDAVVWFAPWQFEEKEEVWKALIYTVLQRLEELERKRSGDTAKIEARMASLLKGVGKLALSSALKALTHSVVDLDKLISFYSANEQDNARFINTFRREFEDLKNEILGTKKDSAGRLVIFVDDLDRCTPENCIMVLEAIKLFFDFKGCVFVLGIDQEVVQKGIEIKYDKRLNVRGVDYLEKMVQLPFTLPPVPKPTFRNFVRTIAGHFNFDKVSIELIAQASDENPRRVKRLCNSLYMVSHVARKLVNEGDLPLKMESLDENKLALLLILQVRFPLAYRWLVANPITFKKLTANWDSLRMGLIAYMEGSYGEGLSNQVASDFFNLIQDASSPPLNIADFRDTEELSDYLRITGVVDVSERPAGKPTREVIDNKMGSIPTPSLEEEKPGMKVGPRGAISQGEFDRIEVKVTSLDKDWRSLMTSGLPILWFRRVRALGEQTLNNLRTAGRMQGLLQDTNFGEEVEGWRLMETIEILDRIQPGRVYAVLRRAGFGLLAVGSTATMIVFSYWFINFSGFYYNTREIPNIIYNFPWIVPIIDALLLAFTLRGLTFLSFARQIREEFITSRSLSPERPPSS